MTIPAVVEDTVFFGTMAGVYAVDTKNSEKLWYQEIGNGNVLDTAVRDGKVFYTYFDAAGECCGDSNKGVGALDISSGEQLWKEPLKYGFDGFAVNDDTIYMNSDDYEHMYHINANTGEIESRVGGGNYGNPVVVDRVVYTPTGQFIFGRDTSTHDVLFKFRLPGTKKKDKDSEVSAGPIVANGVLYAGDTDGYLYALE